MHKGAVFLKLFGLWNRGAQAVVGIGLIAGLVSFLCPILRAQASEQYVGAEQTQFCLGQARSHHSGNLEQLQLASGDVLESVTGFAMSKVTGWLQTAGEFYFGGTVEERAQCLSAFGEFELEIRKSLRAQAIIDPVSQVCFANCMVGSLWDYQHSFSTKYLGECRAILQREGTCTEYSRVLTQLLQQLGYSSARLAANAAHQFVSVRASGRELVADPTGGMGGCGMSLYRK